MARKLGDDKSKAAKAEAEAEARSNLTQATFLDAVRQMAAMDEKVAAMRAARTALRKALKAKGIELGVLDATMKMADWSREEQRENFHRHRQYAAWLGLATGTQGEMFPEMSDNEREEKEWEAVGRTACWTGKPAEPPEECPPKFHQAFMRGWHEADQQVWDDAAPEPSTAPAEGKKTAKKKKPRPASKAKADELADIKNAAAERAAREAAEKEKSPARDVVREAVRAVAEKKKMAEAKQPAGAKDGETPPAPTETPRLIN